MFLYISQANGKKLGINALDENLVSEVVRQILGVFQHTGLAFAWSDGGKP
jgi:hypothetical protein